VSITITTLKNDIARILEPGAPLPNKRIEALKKLSDDGIKCSVRLDPLIPGLNDGEIEEIVKETAEYCEHIVSSTIKPRKNGLERMTAAFPKIMNGLRFNQKIGNSYYLSKDLRYSLMKRVRDACDANGLTFATCREGFVELHNATCDGSQLI
jgi:DNA repair photolyase